MTIRSINTSGLPQGVLTPMGDLLFAASEPGAWYDPSDMSTLFQDSAGTVPVTAVEQPVGLMLDKTKPIVLNGDVRMNVLPSEASDWAGWNNNTVVGNKIIPNTTNGVHGVYKSIPSAGLDYIIKVKAKAAGYSKFYISDAGYGRVCAAYDLANGTIISAASNIPHDAAIVHLGDGVYELSVKVNAVTAISLAITPYPDTGATLSAYVATFAGDGVSGVEVYAVDARLVTQADTLPRYQYTPANTWSRFRGNHASQATSTKRPKYSRRVNVLLNTENPSAWPTTGITGTAEAGGVSLLQSTADSSEISPSSLYPIGWTPISNSCIYRSIEYLPGDALYLAYGPASGGSFVTIRTSDGVVVGAAGGASPLRKITPLSDGWVRVETWDSLASQGASQLSSYLYFGNTFDGLYIANAGRAGTQIRVRQLQYVVLPFGSTHSVPYQSVTTATDYDADPAKFPGYLLFDGVDDALATGNIDFTGTDKMTVWAGVTRMSDTPSQMIAEISSVAESQPGSWFLASQYTASYNYFANSLGVPGNGRAVAHLAAPGVSQDYISFQADLSAPSPAGRLNMRRNALASPPNTSDFGYGGTYGNYPLYIGARAGTSLYFNGRLYGLIARGAQSTLSQIEATELYIKRKMRLP